MIMELSLGRGAAHRADSVRIHAQEKANLFDGFQPSYITFIDRLKLFEIL